MLEADHSTTPMADDDRADESDSLEEIEFATAVLVRNFELLRRRSDIYTELDRAEYLLLRTLDRKGPVDIRTLAAALGLDSSTAGRQLATMQTKGLVQRNPATADQRCSIVSPTEDGLRKMATTRARRRASTEELLSDWSHEDRRLLGEMFTRYNQAVAETYLS